MSYDTNDAILVQIWRELLTPLRRKFISGRITQIQRKSTSGGAENENTVKKADQTSISTSLPVFGIYLEHVTKGLKTDVRISISRIHNNFKTHLY